MENDLDLEIVDLDVTPVSFGNQEPLRRAGEQRAKAEQAAAVVALMKAQKAAWQEDQRGIRGAVEVVSSVANKLDWSTSQSIARRPELNTVIPEVITTADVPTEEQEAPVI